MIKVIVSNALCAVCCIPAHSQNAKLTGVIRDEKHNPLPGATVFIRSLNIGAEADKQGLYTLSHIPLGTYGVSVKMNGYRTLTQTIRFSTPKTYSLDLYLKPDNRKLPEVVVTGSRERIDRKKSPVVVNTIDRQTFDAVQAVSLGQALNFQPGLRYEQDCQFCGYSQLRMNGLSGAYTQILIDGRPVFGPLTGYGLDQIPTVMIDRIEVISSGGSSIYGRNAIAGTVNIITRDPVIDGFQIETQTALIDGERSDNNISFAASTAGDNLNLSTLLYGNFRRRNWYDANDDQYSEIPKISNNSFGFNSYYRPGDRSKLKLESHFIDESRRGGTDFEKPVDKAKMALQLDHQIYGGQLSYELDSKDQTNHYSAYLWSQAVYRKEDVHKPMAMPSMNMKGKSMSEMKPGAMKPGEMSTSGMKSMYMLMTDRTRSFSGIAGLQWNKIFHRVLRDEAAWVSGIEGDREKLKVKYSHKRETDKIHTDQSVWNTAAYARFSFNPLRKLTTAIGARLDWVHIDSDYLFQDHTERHSDYATTELSPGLNLRYAFSDHLRLRTSYASGFRAPQASVLMMIDDAPADQNLKTEKSDNFTASLNWDYASPQFYMEILLEGFYTQIDNPFITEPQDQDDYLRKLIRNGVRSRVSGINFRIDNSFHSRIQTQVGLTWQSARYDKPEEILDRDKIAEGGASSSKKIMRTPNLYGYFTAHFEMSNRFDLDLSGVYTGSMVVPYYGGGTLWEGKASFYDSPEFFELNTQLNHHLPLITDCEIDLSAGVQNIFNRYQDNFDSGPNRSNSFIYGPYRPRTFFVGIKIGNLD